MNTYDHGHTNIEALAEVAIIDAARARHLAAAAMVTSVVSAVLAVIGLFA